MAVDHQATQLALRTQLRTLSVATTGSTTLAATATGYTRTTGSFLTDGFAAGMEVAPTGFTDTAVGVITSVSALTMTIHGGRTAETAASGRTLAVGIPSICAWDNAAAKPIHPQPYLEEEYVPATSELRTFPATGGSMQDTGLYIIRWFSREGTGLPALRKPADAILELFTVGTALTVSSGVVVRPRSDTAPVAGAVLSDGGGWSVVAITIPWRLDYVHA